MVETNGEYLITAEMPGLKKEDLKVEYADGVLTVCGQKQETQKKEDAQYYFCERSYGAFQRAFTFPGNVDPDKVPQRCRTASCRSHVPKTAKVKVQPKTIAIGEAK